MSFRAYLISRIFFKNLAIAIIATFVLLLVSMYAVRIYTHHGESFTVPDFSGMELGKVENQIEQQGLLFAITDSVYTKDVKPGTVIGQMPVPGSHVKEGRTVFLTICAIRPEQVSMPKLTDISLRQAVNIMQRVGLNIGEIVYVPSEYPNLVLAQKQGGAAIPEGQKIVKGSEIDLLVGKSGSGERTVVPNLIGVTLEQAENEIAALVLTVGSVIYDESVQSLSDSLNARVWQQHPDVSSAEVDQGTSIDLWMTVDEGKLNNEIDPGTESGNRIEPGGGEADPAKNLNE